MVAAEHPYFIHTENVVADINLPA